MADNINSFPLSTFSFSKGKITVSPKFVDKQLSTKSLFLRLLCHSDRISQCLHWPNTLSQCWIGLLVYHSAVSVSQYYLQRDSVFPKSWNKVLGGTGTCILHIRPQYVQETLRNTMLCWNSHVQPHCRCFNKKMVKLEIGGQITFTLIHIT